MLNGRREPVVTPEMAQRLYDAAAEPKSLKWYNSGHLRPERAYHDAARVDRVDVARDFPTLVS